MKTQHKRPAPSPPSSSPTPPNKKNTSPLSNTKPSEQSKQTAPSPPKAGQKTPPSPPPHPPISPPVASSEASCDAQGHCEGKETQIEKNPKTQLRETEHASSETSSKETPTETRLPDATQPRETPLKSPPLNSSPISSSGSSGECDSNGNCATTPVGVPKKTVQRQTASASHEVLQPSCDSDGSCTTAGNDNVSDAKIPTAETHDFSPTDTKSATTGTNQDVETSSAPAVISTPESSSASGASLGKQESQGVSGAQPEPHTLRRSKTQHLLLDDSTDCSYLEQDKTTQAASTFNKQELLQQLKQKALEKSQEGEKAALEILNAGKTAEEEAFRAAKKRRKARKASEEAEKAHEIEASAQKSVQARELVERVRLEDDRRAKVLAEESAARVQAEQTRRDAEHAKRIAFADSFEPQPGVAFRLAFLAQPSAESVAGSLFAEQPVVVIEDFYGTVVSTLPEPQVVTLSLLTVFGEQLLLGNISQPVIAAPTVSDAPARSSSAVANATFVDIHMRLVGTYNIQASCGVLGVAISQSFEITHAPPSRLSFHVQPTSVVTAGRPFDVLPVVHVLDEFGNLALSPLVKVQLSLISSDDSAEEVGKGKGLAELKGVTWAFSMLGVAEFTVLFVERAGVQHLVASAGRFSQIATATSNPIAVQNDFAVKLAFGGRLSDTARAGFIFAGQPVVTTIDRFGNVGCIKDRNVTLSVVQGAPPGVPSSKILKGTLTVPVQKSGHAYFSGLFIKRVGRYVFAASSGSLQSGKSKAITIKPAAPFSLRFKEQPPSAAVAGANLYPAPIVEVLDEFGNLVNDQEVPLRLVLTGSPDGATLHQKQECIAKMGECVFKGVLITSAWPFYRLRAEGPDGVVMALSDSFVVSPSLPTLLAFHTLASPTSVAGHVWERQPIVEVRDSFGNRANFSGSVSLSVVPERGSATFVELEGETTAQQVEEGFAFFRDLKTNTAARFKLVASAGITLRSAESPYLKVLPSAPSSAKFGDIHWVVVAGDNVYRQQVQLFDRFGNKALANSVVHLTAHLDGQPAPLQGNVTVAALNGLVTFPTIVFQKAGTYVMQAWVDCVRLDTSSKTVCHACATSPQFQVKAGAPYRLKIVGAASSVVAGEPFEFSVLVMDQFDNQVMDSKLMITAAVDEAQQSDCGILSGTTSTRAAHGLARFSSSHLTKAHVGCVLKANAGHLVPAQSARISVRPAAAHALQFRQTLAGTLLAGTVFPEQPIVDAVDEFGNVATHCTEEVTISVSGKLRGKILRGNRTTSFVSGVARWAGLSAIILGEYSLEAVSSFAFARSSTRFAIVPGDAASLRFTLGPAAKVEVGQQMKLEVEILDAFENRVTRSHNLTLLYLDTYYSTARPVLAAAGLADASALVVKGGHVSETVAGYAIFKTSITRAGNGQRLAVVADDSDAVQPAVSEPVVVSAGDIVGLKFVHQPSPSIQAGSSLSASVRFHDKFGNTVPVIDYEVEFFVRSVSKRRFDPTAIEYTSLSVNGVVALHVPVVTRAGPSQVVAKCGSSEATSNVFDVTPHVPVGIAVATFDLSLVAGSTPKHPPTFNVVDVYGNIVKQTKVPVTLSGRLRSEKDDSLDLHFHAVTTCDDHQMQGCAAIFLDFVIPRAGVYDFHLTSPAFSSDELFAPSVLVVGPSIATQLVFSHPPPRAIAAGEAFTVVVRSEDEFGNASPINGVVHLTSDSSPLRGDVEARMLHGVATFHVTRLAKVGKTAVSATLSNPSVMPCPAFEVEVAAGAPASLVFLSSPPSRCKTREVFVPQPTVAIVDGYGNIVLSSSVVVSLWARDNLHPQAATTVSTVQGIANFTDLFWTRAGRFIIEATVSDPAEYRTLKDAVTSEIVVFEEESAKPAKLSRKPGQESTGDEGTLLTGPEQSKIGDENVTSTKLEASTVRKHREPFFSSRRAKSSADLDKVGNETHVEHRKSTPTMAEKWGDQRAKLKAIEAERRADALPPPVLGKPWLRIVYGPMQCVAGLPVPGDIHVELRDGDGVRQRQFGVTVELALHGHPIDSLTGTSHVQTNRHGVAIFTSISVTSVGTAMAFEARSRHRDPVVGPSEITVAPGRPASIAWTKVSARNVTCGDVLAPVQVSIQDRYKNIVPTVSCNLTISAKPGRTQFDTPAQAQGNVTVAFVDGVATFDDIWLDKTGVYRLLAMCESGSPSILSSLVAQSPPIRILPAAPSSLHFRVQPLLPGRFNRTLLRAPVVAVLDRFGNVVEDSAAIISLRVAPCPKHRRLIAAGKGTYSDYPPCSDARLQGETSVRVTGGFAMFSNLNVDQDGAFALLATSPELDAAVSIVTGHEALTLNQLLTILSSVILLLVVVACAIGLPPGFLTQTIQLGTDLLASTFSKNVKKAVPTGHGVKVMIDGKECDLLISVRSKK